MIIVPNSYGSALAEKNDCHTPAGSSAGGQFCSKGGGSARPVPIRVKTMKEAVERILRGEVIELEDVEDVNTLLDRLGDMAKDAAKRGEAAPNYDLCKVSVRGTNLFCAESLGLPRVTMPQLKGVPVPGSPASRLEPDEDGQVNAAEAFLRYLKEEHGIDSDNKKMKAAKLKATQNELVGSKVARLMRKKSYDPEERPIFVSNDHYVLDGHHHWAAAVGRDTSDNKLGDLKVRVEHIDAPISELLKLAKTWTREFGIRPKAAGAS